MRDGPYIALTVVAGPHGRVLGEVDRGSTRAHAGNRGSVDRVGYVEAAVVQNGTFLGLRYKWVDNNGAYVRTPEPATLYRTTGNLVGPHKVRNL